VHVGMCACGSSKKEREKQLKFAARTHLTYNVSYPLTKATHDNAVPRLCCLLFI
jgi:hypothetical protein